MKFRRFFALFLSLLISAQLCVTSFAAEGDVGDWEVLAKAGTLHVGIYGKTESKTRPTLWAIGKTIKDGAEPCEASQEPTPDKWQQLLDELKRIAGADPEVINPIIEEYISENPDEFRGPAGYTPERGVDYYTEADKAEMVSAVLAALPSGDEVSY